MSKLNNFTKHLLKNFTYLELMQTITERITDALQSITIEPARQAALAFIAAVRKMDEEYKKATSSALTKPLADADDARDHAYSSFSAVVRAMEASGVAALVAAAKELIVPLNTYHVSPSAQINEESGAILQLCQELDKHTDAIATLGLTEVYAELKKQNDLVRSLLKERNAEQAFDQTGVMKRHRAIVDAAFDTLSDYFNAVICLYPTEDMERLVAILNKDIDYVRIHNGMGSAFSGNGKTDTTSEGDGQGGAGTTDDGNGTTDDDHTTEQPTPTPGGGNGLEG